MFLLNRGNTRALTNKIGIGLYAMAAQLIFSAISSAVPGDLYVSDLTTNSIVIYHIDGTSTTFATGLNSPQGLTFDQAGNLFVADGGSGNVFEFAPDGTRITFASGFSNPVGLAINGLDLLVSENTADKVTRVAPDGSKTDFPATLTAPLGVTAQSVGMVPNVYIAAANGTIKVAPDGSATTIYSGTDGRFVAVDSDGNVFISVGAGDIKKISTTGATTTFASGIGDPHGIAFRPKRFNGDTERVGNLFVADPLGGFIFEFAPDGSEVLPRFVSGGRPNFVVFETGTIPEPTPTPTPSPSPTPEVLQNISTRDNVLTGDDVMIGGFIVTGGTEPKKVIVRAIGPSLSDATPPVSGALGDPVLELHHTVGGIDEIIASNDNWKSDQQAEIEATGVPPTNDLESAIVTTLAPQDLVVTGSGEYTAIVRGINGTTGIALVEVFDLDDPLTTTSELANISTRGFVSTGDNVLIGGFIIGPGLSDGKVLIRAIGPSLNDAGVPTPLQDPTLELHNEDGTMVVLNDNWRDSAETEILETGLAPRDDAESAILATLVPGNYTFIIRGVNDTTGVALVEAFHLPADSPAQPQR